MVLVSGITMISILLIVILERTNMIGILKSFGAKNILIRKLFIYNSIHIIGRGMLWGNLIGLMFCLLQQHFGILGLDQESYYISVVPINIDVLSIIIINILTFVVCSLILIIPSLIIGKISPLKAIRFN
jgi:lipoprotein-releasing system permease protein